MALKKAFVFTISSIRFIVVLEKVWTVQIPQTYTENDFEYFIDVTVNKVDYRVFPVTAPTQCQTVTVW